jgi:hypothetical protein
MSVMSGDIQDMCRAIEDRMVQSSITSNATIADESECRHGEWHADDMTVRSCRVGCRLAALNAAKKFHSAESYKDEVSDLMDDLTIDILLIAEPGKLDSVAYAAMRNYAIGKDWAAEAVGRHRDSSAGGQVMFIRARWAKLQRTVHAFKPKLADRDRVLAVEFDNKQQGAHNKLLVVGYYGYNDAPAHRAEIKEMHDFIWGTYIHTSSFISLQENRLLTH